MRGIVVAGESGVHFARLNDPGRGMAFSDRVVDPRGYGGFDDDFTTLLLEEEPECHGSNYAVTGLCSCGIPVVEIARSFGLLIRCKHGLMDMSGRCLDQGDLAASVLPRRASWVDADSFSEQSDVTVLTRPVQDNRSMKTGCLGGVGWHKGFSTDDQLCTVAAILRKYSSGRCLLAILDEREAPLGP